MRDKLRWRTVRLSSGLGSAHGVMLLLAVGARSCKRFMNACNTKLGAC